MTAPDPAQWQEHAARHERLLPRELRKRRGAWFTPMALAAPTAARALVPLLGDATRPLAVCDPAVGGGAFLLAAATTLRAHGALSRSRLVGLDVDAQAARIAEASVAAAAQGARVDVHHGDGLLELEPGSFDCVLTNPPWETLQGSDDARERVAALRQHFRHQGSGKLYTYRLFVERAVELLRPGGRLGLVVPASLWFDRDAEPLRRLLLDACDWQWLYGFENRAKVFAIDGRYRFGVVVATKGERTKRVQVAFGCTDVARWAEAEPPHVAYDRDELRALSPGSGAFVEVEHPRDLDVLRRMHARGRPLCGADGALAWRQGDFNMTADRGAFVPRDEAERLGYRRDDDGVFRCAGRRDLLPLFQGAMVYDLDANAGAHLSGSGHGTRWRPPVAPDELRPLYLVDADAWRAGRATRPPARIALRALSNATNERTAIACLLADAPCGNSLGVLTPGVPAERPLLTLAAAAAVLASLPFDWALRMRLAGTNLNRFVLEDCVLPEPDDATTKALADAALRLCTTPPWQRHLWQVARDEGWAAPDGAPAVAADERRALATRIDTLVGRAFGLEAEDVAWITRGCEQPPDRTFAKGFWRVERELPAAMRRPNRWRAAAAHG